MITEIARILASVIMMVLMGLVLYHWWGILHNIREDRRILAHFLAPFLPLLPGMFTEKGAYHRQRFGWYLLCFVIVLAVLLFAACYRDSCWSTMFWPTDYPATPGRFKGRRNDSAGRTAAWPCAPTVTHAPSHAIHRKRLARCARAPRTVATTNQRTAIYRACRRSRSPTPTATV